MRIVLFGQAAFGKDIFDKLREEVAELGGLISPFYLPLPFSWERVGVRVLRHLNP